MIINDRKDLDAAPPEVREQFMTRLANGINRWVWDGNNWVIQQDDSTITRYAFTLADFPNAPVPEMPDYNPDKKALQQARESAVLSRANFKLALLEAGYLQDVKDFVAQSADDRIAILWEDSASFERMHPDLLLLASQMGYTDEQMDALFGIEV